RFIGPPSPDYIPRPKEPQSPPPPDFVPEPVYPEFMPPKDEILPAEEKPIPAADSPTADSPGYIPKSDPKEDPEEDDDEDPKEDPADYPADRGDDDDEPSDDDEDEEVDIEADDKEVEEHPAPADSTAIALPAIDQAPSVEETDPFETDESTATPPPHPTYRVTARISIPAPVPTPVWSDAEVAKLLAISTLPSSPLSPWSSPLPRIPSPPLPPIPSPSLPVSPLLPVSSPVPVLSPSPPASPIRPLGYRAAMIRLRAEAASTSHSLPLPPPIILSHTRPTALSSRTPPLHLLSTDHREDRPESLSAAGARPAGGLRADYGFVATMDREIRRDLERDVGYGITDSWDEIVEAMQGTPVVTDVTGRQLLAGRLNMLFRDRRAHARTARLIETEARMSDEAWGGYRQRTLNEGTKKALDGRVTRQQGPANGPAQPEPPEEAGSSSYILCTVNANNANNEKGATGRVRKPTYYECGVQGHFKRECTKLKNNNNRGNQVGGGNAPAKGICGHDESCCTIHLHLSISIRDTTIRDTTTFTIPLPTPSPPLLLPSTVYRAGVFEVTLLPRKRLCIALGPRFEDGKSSSAPTARPTRGFKVDYGFVGTLDDEIKRDPKREVGYGIIDTWDEMDTDEIYGRLDDAQDDRSLMSGQLNMLRRDRRTHARTARLMESEARLSRMGGRRHAPLAHECTYPYFMKCKPLYFKGTKGVVELTQWFERMETWNSHVKTVGYDVAYAMTWKNLKKKMTNKYCPRGEVKKLESEMWNLKVKGGLPDMIYGSVMASKPKTMHDAIKFATELIDKKIRTFTEQQSENKRRQDDNQQQQHNKRQNIGRAYAAGSGKKKPYIGSKPLCSKCNYHRDVQCAPKCHKCNKVGHLDCDCRITANASIVNNQRGIEAGRNDNAPAKVYVVGRARINPDSNVVTGMFLLNNCYASILFETGADRSFMSNAFSSQIDITPSTLDHYYDVKLADERIIRLNAIIRGCTLNFLNHPFNIDLMPIELDSFDVIIGMDWLAKYQAVIVCAEKIFRIPWGNETLIVHGDGRDRGNETRLNIISCTKTQKYLLKGCPVFLAHVTTKETKDRFNEDGLGGVSIV
ncbi:reverse transcriptase domain-containing protein, partial [Tanacetum coccineum]